MKTPFLGAVLGSLMLLGCAKGTPLQPVSRQVSPERVSESTAAQRSDDAAPAAARRNAPGRPGYEPAYVGGETVIINAIEVPPVAPEKAQADFYEVVYPIGWEGLGIGTPQCNPCDHEGNGIDPSDYHDHVLDSMPGSPGHGEFSPLWHVFVVIPAYGGNTDHDAQVTSAYASHIPAKSEEAVEELLDAKMADGSPVAVKIDTHFYFLCAVVNWHAPR